MINFVQAQGTPTLVPLVPYDETVVQQGAEKIHKAIDRRGIKEDKSALN